MSSRTLSSLLLTIILGCAAMMCLAITAPGAAHAKCKMSTLTPQLLTSEKTVLPANAAILIELGRSYERRENYDFGESYVLVKDAQKIPLKLEQLAPGLARLVPERPPTTGVWTIKGDLTGRATVTFGAAVEPLPAVATPEVLKVVLHRENARKRRGFHEQITATLSAPLPDGVVVVVGDWSADGTRDSYQHAPEQRGVEVNAYATPGRCRSSARGTRKGDVGSKGALYFVDAYGMISSPSESFEVGEPAAQ